MSLVTPGTPSPPGDSTPTASVHFRIPPLGTRLSVGALRLVLLFLALVVVPVGVLETLRSLSIPVPISIQTEEVYGISISVLLAARYVLRPTRAYGPLCIAAATATILFLFTLLVQSSYHLAIPQAAVAVTISFAAVVILLLLIPCFALAAGIVTTLEDARWPGERLEFDYPA